MKKVFFILIMILLLAGCTAGGKSFLFVKSVYNPYGFEEDKAELKKVKKIFKEYNLSFRSLNLETMNPEGVTEQILSALSQGDLAYLLYGPLLEEVVSPLIEEYPQVTFVSFIDNKENEAVNLIKIRPDKLNVMKKAGMLCGYLLNQEYERLMSQKAPGEKPKVGILSYNVNNRVSEEVDAFKEGFLAKDNEASSLIIEPVRNLYNKNNINEDVNKLLNQGVVILFPRLFSANQYCLELAGQRGGVLVLEDWYDRSSSENLLFSIDQEFTDLIKGILDPESRKTGIAYVSPRLKWGSLIESDERISSIINSDINSEFP